MNQPALFPDAPADAPKPSARLVLVDGSNLFFRGKFSRFAARWRGRDATCLAAYLHALPALVASLSADAPADFIVCWDSGHAERTRLSEAAVAAGLVPKAYKQERREARAAEGTAAERENFQWQYELAKEATGYTRLGSFALPGEEADDLAGSFVRLARETGAYREIVVATSDRDYYQLLGPDCRLYNPGAKAFYGPAEFAAEYGLADPGQWVEVGALAGETGPSSDTIYGVPGIGYATAAKLIARHGSLDSLLARAAYAAPGTREAKIHACREIVLLARRLKAMRTALPVAFPPFRGDWRLLEGFLDKYGLSLPATALAALLRP